VLPARPHIPTALQGTSASWALQPAGILDRKLVKRHNTAVVQYLILWEGQPESDASWEDAVAMEEQFPDFCAAQQTFRASLFSRGPVCRRKI